jgi:hypothetical protein
VPRLPAAIEADITALLRAGEPLPGETYGRGATAAEIARGLADAYDAASMHMFGSWTMGDLYRAIAYEPDGPGQKSAIDEYAAEIKRRRQAERDNVSLQAQLDAALGINEEKLP